MGYCIKCGQLLNENHQFCPSCGGKNKEGTSNPQFHENKDNASQIQSNTIFDPENTLKNAKIEDYKGGYWDESGIDEQTKNEKVSEEDKKSGIYKFFSKSEEYNPDWLNVETQSLKIEDDDEIILRHWVTAPIKLETTFKQSIKLTLQTVLWFSFYALLSYFLYDQNSNYLNYTIQAFFFPFMFYVFGCFKRFDKFIKALLFSTIISLAVIAPLYNAQIISEEGIPFLLPILFLRNIDDSLWFDIISSLQIHDVEEVMVTIILFIFIIELILLFINWLLKRNPKLEYVISKNAFFIRAKTKKSTWENIKCYLWVFINPFNVAAYKEIRDRMKYNKMTSKEGREYDFARITIDDIIELKKKPNKLTFNLIIVFLIGYLGFAVGFFPLLLISIVLFIKTIRYKGTYSIYIRFNSTKIEGSWAKINKCDILKLIKTPPELAQYFHDTSNF